MTYETRNEIEFLERLGSWGESEWFEMPSRQSLLEGYRIGALKRSRWGDISREAVMTAIDYFLAVESARVRCLA